MMIAHDAINSVREGGDCFVIETKVASQDDVWGGAGNGSLAFVTEDRSEGFIAFWNGLTESTRSGWRKPRGAAC